VNAYKPSHINIMDKNPYTGKPKAKEKVIVWTQEQTPHSRNRGQHP
jgi:hypothetical protein